MVGPYERAAALRLHNQAYTLNYASNAYQFQKMEHSSGYYALKNIFQYLCKRVSFNFLNKTINIDRGIELFGIGK